jgi:hypothetical protein
MLLLALLSLDWGAAPDGWQAALLAAAALGCLALALGYAGYLSGWPALSVDSIVMALLLHGTDHTGSPLLPLALLLILQGGLLGGSNGALAGSAAGVALLLMHGIEGRHPHGVIAMDLALLQLAAGVSAAWFWRKLRGLFTAMSDRLQAQEEHARELERAQHLMSWRRLNLQLAACTTIEQLLRRANSQAQQIAHTNANVSLTEAVGAGEAASDIGPAQIPIACGDVTGAITIGRARSELSPAQHDALAHLATLVGLRVAQLRHAAVQKRQQAALTALWEICGLLRVASGGSEIVREALERLAGALDLDWLALLSPDGRGALAPVVVARGQRARAAPLLNGAQIRVAAEALRGERSLVRMEGAASLVCLPVRLAGHAPLIIAARGDAGDLASQTLLMIFGDLIGGQLAASCAMSNGRVARA